MRFLLSLIQTVIVLITVGILAMLAVLYLIGEML